MFLSPQQCFALNGFDARRLQLDENVPERELCKMAGNTMAVPVLQIMLSTALAQIAP